MIETVNLQKCPTNKPLSLNDLILGKIRKGLKRCPLTELESHLQKRNLIHNNKRYLGIFQVQVNIEKVKQTKVTAV